ncbi:hypothetical protein, partial [Pseudovibrio sp. POLY-S9]|uniref:hypothetical protein n=1 Tax=Pseudovibrio sp. POLY-S9 TaxID=1576596 RepID=UPI001910EAB4
MFEEERETISKTIAEKVVNLIRNNTSELGEYKLPSDQDILAEEIRVFTEDLGYPTEAYPGHDLIDLTNMTVKGATEGVTVVEAAVTLAEAIIQNNAVHYYMDGELVSTIEALSRGAKPIPKTGLLEDPNGQLLKSVSGVFSYKGEVFHQGQLEEVDGVYYVTTQQFGRVPVGVTKSIVGKLVYDLWHGIPDVIEETVPANTPSPIREVEKTVDDFLDNNDSSEITDVIREVQKNVQTTVDSITKTVGNYYDWNNSTSLTHKVADVAGTIGKALQATNPIMGSVVSSVSSIVGSLTEDVIDGGYSQGDLTSSPTGGGDTGGGDTGGGDTGGGDTGGGDTG